WLGTLENPIDIGRCALEQNAEVGTMNDKSSDPGIFPKRVDSRGLAFCQSRCDLASVAKKEKIGRDQNSVRVCALQPQQSALDFVTATNLENINRYVQLFRDRP